MYRTLVFHIQSTYLLLSAGQRLVFVCFADDDDDDDDDDDGEDDDNDDVRDFERQSVCSSVSE